MHVVLGNVITRKTIDARCSQKCDHKEVLLMHVVLGNVIARKFIDARSQKCDHKEVY